LAGCAEGMPRKALAPVGGVRCLVILLRAKIGAAC
jgi:hypothetical protein